MASGVDPASTGAAEPASTTPPGPGWSGPSSHHRAADTTAQADADVLKVVLDVVGELHDGPLPGLHLHATPQDAPALIDAALDAEGLAAICAPDVGDRARPRRFEIAAALNRLRSLEIG